MHLLSTFNNKRKSATFTSSTLVLCGLTCSIFISHPVMAQPADTNSTSLDSRNECKARQVSTKTLPILDSSCPIGVGLWGKQQPKLDDGMFWIQCGVYSKQLSVEQAKVLYKVISTDVWLHLDANSYRCLIGPYFSFSTAQQELRRVKEISVYNNAVLRQVKNHQGEILLPPTPRPVVSPKAPVVKTSTQKPSVSAPIVNSEKTPSSAPSSTLQSFNIPPSSSSVSSVQATIRRQTQVGSLSFVVPYKRSRELSFYMEYQQAWNRLSYSDAKKMCESLNMMLVNKSQWEMLRATGIIEKERWPYLLPYWGSDTMGLFPSDGSVKSLKESSLLNVICVK